MSESLYEQLGGEAAVDAAVDIFYRKILGDTTLAPFFEGVDLDKQAAKQKAFLTMAFGGPNNYSGKDLTSAHAALVARGLNDSHVTAVLNHLMKTLQELKVPGYLVVEIMKIAESTRNAVLGR
ncbi:group I truncated hemoglobin [Methylogaea oryzae]|uniref:Group 1 truncated hemoglobin n=1 Tax=Methylogaea oryzae TaxID=1295382 RepID=A0A8D4VSW4_9GAMM|nr:group 1 truncated hemoglobin [Methylogaea oryzae]BBL72647.1 group 1 truncated hemoglobin [Methylogaea oryzae]